MARTMDVNADPIARPEWMSPEALEHLLDHFPQSGFEWSVTMPKPPVANPFTVFYECEVAWSEQWPYSPVYGKPCEEEEDGPHWTDEVAEYLGEGEPADEDSMYNREWLKRCEFNRKIELALPDMWSHEFVRRPRKRRYGSTAKQLRRDGLVKWSRANRKSNYDQEGKCEAERRSVKHARSGSAQPGTPNPWSWTPNRGGSGAYRTESRPRIKWTMSGGCVDRRESISDGSWMPRVGSRR